MAIDKEFPEWQGKRKDQIVFSIKLFVYCSFAIIAIAIIGLIIKFFQ